jgi:hypothetical protein
MNEGFDPHYPHITLGYVEAPGCNPDPGIAPGEPHPGGPEFDPASLAPMLQFLLGNLPLGHLPFPLEPHSPWLAPDPVEPTIIPL